MDVWEKLKQTNKPIVLYGMGNGADKILSVFGARGIEARGVFASDGFVRAGKTFHGFPVRGYADTVAEFGDVCVVVAFASALPDVVANVERIAAERELYVPDVPVAGGGLFDSAFYGEHRDELAEVRNMLADERSRRVFDLVCEAKLTGDPDALTASADDEEEFGYGLLKPEKYTAYADLGAYTGDTLRAACAVAPSLARAWAFEPDRRSFAKLRACADTLPFEVECVQAAAWSRSGATLTFADGEGRGSAVTASDHAHAVVSAALDDVVRDAHVDFIKFDVEGAESEAIRGARRVISHCQPDVRCAIYHRPEDLFAIPRALRELLPDHRFFVRRARSFPAWDVDLFAVGG